MKMFYPQEFIEVISITPKKVPGFTLEHQPGLINFDAIFEGRLNTKVTFKPKN